MRGSRKLCQRRPNFNFFLVDEGRDDQNIIIGGPSSAGVSETPFKWRFAGGPIMAQH